MRLTRDPEEQAAPTLYIRSALLERNAREVGFADNIGEHRVQEHRQELVGVEWHRSSVSDLL